MTIYVFKSLFHSPNISCFPSFTQCHQQSFPVTDPLGKGYSHHSCQFPSRFTPLAFHGSTAKTLFIACMCVCVRYFHRRVVSFVFPAFSRKSECLNPKAGSSMTVFDRRALIKQRVPRKNIPDQNSSSVSFADALYFSSPTKDYVTSQRSVCERD